MWRHNHVVKREEGVSEVMSRLNLGRMVCVGVWRRRRWRLSAGGWVGLGGCEKEELSGCYRWWHLLAQKVVESVWFMCEYYSTPALFCTTHCTRHYRWLQMKIPKEYINSDRPFDTTDIGFMFRTLCVWGETDIGSIIHNSLSPLCGSTFPF